MAPIEYGRARIIASPPPEVALTGVLHVARALRGGVPRQDAFLILKLATYSSGFAGSKGSPITENDVYDVAGGVRPVGHLAIRRVTAKRF
jgi:hypothetical protein